ncbi:MAG: hypothetical protein AAF527_05635, partial [Pseudomonadota bacterium]
MKTSREILFEFRAVGDAVQAIAVDPLSGREASITAPAHTPQRYLETLAARKLMRRTEAQPDRSNARGVLL